VAAGSSTGPGVLASSEEAAGVEAGSLNGRGVTASSTSGPAVNASSANGNAVVADCPAGGTAVEASSFDGIAVRGHAGHVVNGVVTQGGAMFRTDHPLDPENRFLSHSAVESPQMKNVYDGTVNLDAEGKATVTLPEWFDAFNESFRYQLTPVGAAAPSLHVSRKLSGNSFAVAGGDPGLEVSWQVTGVRCDAWARANRVAEEDDKAPEERGLHWPKLSLSKLRTMFEISNACRQRRPPVSRTRHWFTVVAPRPALLTPLVPRPAAAASPVAATLRR
jgi:hypothetical protein